MVGSATETQQKTVSCPYSTRPSCIDDWRVVVTYKSRGGEASPEDQNQMSHHWYKSVSIAGHRAQLKIRQGLHDPRNVYRSKSWLHWMVQNQG